MTIDDELLLELFKPDYYEKVGKGALIVNVVGTGDIDYKLEETYELTFWRISEVRKMTPDIIVTKRTQPETIAIELENDFDWDFQKSLRKLKKYRKKFGDVRVIIPREYKKFGPLYFHEGFRVYLWSAKRKWKYLKCHFVNSRENRFANFMCEGKTSDGKPCKNGRRDLFEMVGLEDIRIEEFKPEDASSTKA
ncbi:hypothetical protein MUO79_01425 [Candidatus Bathyarchaeota archaeon]|nr:hypothetical protein [Candidatus Bathyarchaeota archaeon]